MPLQLERRDARANAFVQDRFEVLDFNLDGVVALAPPGIWRSKNRVGGSCLGSPTTITCRPRPMAPIASQVGICDASSKMTRSNGSASAGRYWATDSGLIIRQGISRRIAFGMRSASWRTGRCRCRLRQFAGEHRIFRIALALCLPWDGGGQSRASQARGQVQKSGVQRAEPLDPLLVLCSDEPLEAGRCLDRQPTHQLA